MQLFSPHENTIKIFYDCKLKVGSIYKVLWQLGGGQAINPTGERFQEWSYLSRVVSPWLSGLRCANKIKSPTKAVCVWLILSFSSPSINIGLMQSPLKYWFELKWEFIRFLSCLFMQRTHGHVFFPLILTTTMGETNSKSHSEIPWDLTQGIPGCGTILWLLNHVD